MRITIDVTRGDGHVTRLEGVAGMAMMLSAPVPLEGLEPNAKVPMPAMAVRASTTGELAVMLAAMLAFCRHQDPGIVKAAEKLAPIIDVGRPLWRRELDR